MQLSDNYKKVMSLKEGQITKGSILMAGLKDNVTCWLNLDEIQCIEEYDKTPYEGQDPVYICWFRNSGKKIMLFKEL